MKLITILRNYFMGTANIERLKAKGLKIGKDCFIGSGTFIDPSHCFLITIGDNVTFSSKVHLIAHDASTKKHLGYTKIGQIHIGNNVFVGSNALILPGVKIGDNAILGAEGVFTKSVPANEVWAGNPAKYIMSLEEYLDKYQSLKRFDASYRLSDNLSDEKKLELLKATEDGLAFLD